MFKAEDTMVYKHTVQRFLPEYVREKEEVVGCTSTPDEAAPIILSISPLSCGKLCVGNTQAIACHMAPPPPPPQPITRDGQRMKKFLFSCWWWFFFYTPVNVGHNN